MGIAALTATALVAYWSRHDLLPISLLRLRPAPARVVVAGAPLPPAQERLFGPPLRRIGLDDQTPDFEPEAYAMCVLQRITADHIFCSDSQTPQGPHTVQVF